MAQFTIYKNKNPATRSGYPYLMDVQSELLSELQTRVVVPLAKLNALRKKPIRDLTPVLDIEGQSYLLLIPQLSSMPKGELGAPAALATQHRDEIIAALDFLITGI